MKVLHRKVKYIVLSFALALLVTFSFLLPAVTTASAAETTESIYTDVMDDLQKDETFDVADYPVVEDDYSLDVIQIAESSDGELFVYVYQPSDPVKDLIATTVRICTADADDEERTYNDYNLTLLSSYDVFDKYKVENFTLQSDAVRYYEIVQITRLFDISIDFVLDNDNTISQVPCKVAQKWIVYDLGDDIVLSMIETSVVEITDKYVGYMRYPNGWDWNGDYISTSTDAHYVAFSTDVDIERLFEVEISFHTKTTREWASEYDGVGVSVTYDDHYDVLSYSTRVFHDASWFLPEHSWNRIQSVSTFLATEELTAIARENIEEKEWVLRFYESPYASDTVVNLGQYEDSLSTRVESVTILRLKYETQGTVYNLGVVDNFQTGGEDPSNPPLVDLSFIDEWLKNLNSFFDYLKLFVCIIFVGFLLWFLSPAIKWLFNLIWKGICFLFNLLGAPFKWLFNKRKDSRS